MSIATDGKTSSFYSTSYRLEIDDELTAFIFNNANIDNISEERINQLLSLTRSWKRVMQEEIDLIRDIKTGKIINGSAIAEYEFWKVRNIHFKTILKQLSISQTVKKYVTTMEGIIDNQIVQYTLMDLKHMHHEFKIVYETTVITTKHFMDSIYDGIYAIVDAPFSDIIEHFTPLYNNLSLIWMNSSWFSKKKQMERLLELISNSIADRVSKTLNIPKIFRYKTSEALNLIKTGLQILSQWKVKYVQYKNYIEKLSIEHFRRWAWQFDEDIIFNRINFVNFILYDLDKIIDIIEHKMQLSPEVMYIFKDVQETQIFIKKHILHAFFELEIDVYESNSKKNWKDIMDNLNDNFENGFIDKISRSILHSKNVMNDYKALQFVEKMTMRARTVKQLNPLFSNVLKKFHKKINNCQIQFNSLKSSPQIVIDVPPVAANIHLARNLFLRAKRIADVVKSMTKIPRADKKNTLSIYRYFCKEVIAYENKTFAEWLRYAIEVEGRQIQHELLIFRENKLVSTFNKELFDILDTALYLHLLDYELPESKINLIKRNEQIICNFKKVNELVKMYNDIIDKLDAPVSLSMNRHITKLKRTLRPGLEKRYTYLSTQLPKFMDNCMRSLTKFNKMHEDILLSEIDISKKLELVENLIFFPCNFNDTQDIFTTFDRFKIQGNENSSVITKVMDYVAEALNMIERTCHDLETGYREEMSLFYAKYENALFEAFVTMVLNNFKSLKSIWDGDRVAFVVYGRLIDDKFTLSPDLRTIVVMLMTAPDDVLDKLKSTPRWLRTTNVRCPLVQNVETGDMRLPFSFYDCVADRRHVRDAKNICYNSVEVLVDRLKSKIQKLAEIGFVFDKREDIIIGEFAATNPTLKDYQEKLEFFSTLIDGLESQSHVELGCIRLDYSEYNDKVLERCYFWHSIYGKQLIFECEKIMASFSERVTKLDEQLNTPFQDCQGLDVVEKSIKEIKETVFHADAIFHDIDDRFYFLKKHKINISNDQFQQLTNLKNDWQTLYEQALSKSFCFEDAKKGLVG